jgi:hypothetical protein
MSDSAHIAELVRQPDEIEQTLLNHQIDDRETIAMFRNREAELKQELQLLYHEAVQQRLMH